MSRKFKKIKVLAKDLKPGDKLRSFHSYDLVLAVDKKGDQIVVTKRAYEAPAKSINIVKRHVATFTVNEMLKLCVLQEELEELDAALEAL